MNQIPSRTRALLILSIFIGFSSPSFAQKPEIGTISGIVTDESGGQPLEFATVAVYQESDSTLVSGGITDVQGKFTLPVKPGNYYLKIQFISYGERLVSGVKVSPENMKVNLEKITLKEAQVRLEEVTVQAERTEMELQLDKKVYNIGKDLSNLGGSASDLLSNLPSVAVDVDGNVSLRGSENVQILIDGKPSNLVGLSGTGGLQQLQGSMIERVEIITNPSARYDAAGGAGIINIILKKDRSKGFNGSFQLQTGAPANHGASANVNYRTGWINWFLNYGVNYRENPGSGFANNSYANPQIANYINQETERMRAGLSQNIRFGSDIYLNAKNILTLSASYRKADNENASDVFYNYLDENKDSFGNRFRTEIQDEDDINWQYALNYSREFQKRGQKLTFDIQLQENSEVELSNFDDNTYIGVLLDETLLQRSSNENGENQTLIQADYTHPFGTSGRLETGIRYTFRNIYNDYLVESDSTRSGTYEEVIGLSNDFNFDEYIFASYLMYSNKLDKISYQLGTRLEQTDLQTLLEQTNERNNQKYLSFFPSANFTYALTQEMSFQLSYSRRISRPNFRNLNPFVSFTDPLNLFQGNPNLQPQFTDSYEFGVLNNLPKSSLYYGVYYRQTDGVVQRIQTEEEGITTREPRNLAVENSIGLELNISKDFTKAFRTSGNFNFYNSRTYGQGFKAEATTFSIRWGNNYKNEKLFDAQLNVWYRAPQNTPQGQTFSIASVDIGLSKDIMKKNGTVAMNVQDLFNSRKFRGETITDTFTSNSEFMWRRGPTLTLSFTYRLNQSKERQRRRGTQERPSEEYDMEFGGSR